MPLKIPTDDQMSINFAPLIDVLFLLIIFFMVGIRLSDLQDLEHDIPIHVPQVADGQTLTVAPRKRVINVFQDGRIVLDQKQLTLQQLTDQLAAAGQQYQQLGVIVRGDADCTYQAVAEVIAACRQANIRDLNISVRVAQQSSTPLR